MKEKKMDLINLFASIIFLILFVAGAISLFDYTTNYNPLENRLVAICCFFLFGGVGILLELYFCNVKGIKK